MRGSTIAWGLTLLGGGGLALARATKAKPRFPGDLARIGDEVVVPLGVLNLAGNGFPQPPAGLPGQANAGVTVTGTTGTDLLVGRLTSSYAGDQKFGGGLSQDFQALLPPQSINRASVVAVFRNGTRVP